MTDCRHRYRTVRASVGEPQPPPNVITILHFFCTFSAQPGVYQAYGGVRVLAGMSIFFLPTFHFRFHSRPQTGLSRHPGFLDLDSSSASIAQFFRSNASQHQDQDVLQRSSMDTLYKWSSSPLCLFCCLAVLSYSRALPILEAMCHPSPTRATYLYWLAMMGGRQGSRSPIEHVTN